jgi:CDP-diacylglycerol---serine O-phosphatidyltransferase
VKWRARFVRARRRPKKPKVPVRDRARKGLSLLPSMLTLANMICGFYAIVHVGAVVWKDGQPDPANSFQAAAIAILIAMVFDMLDGRVARMTNSTSDFGAQLDSLADAITFGVAPGVMVAMLHAMGRYGGGQPFWSKVAWVFGMVYACAAVIRLARFNVETSDHSEEAHLTFKGLPSPAAAGVVATLILLQHRFTGTQLGQGLLNAMPFVALASGYLMISRFKYPHLANRFLKGRKPAEYLTAIVFGAVPAILFPEVTIAIGFCGFALSGPVLGFRDWMLASPPPAETEAQASTETTKPLEPSSEPPSEAPASEGGEPAQA